MNELDLKMSNLRAQIEGQQETIRTQETEITRLRKRDVEITQQLEDEIEQMKELKSHFEELRDRHTTLIGQILELMDRLGNGRL